MEFENADGATLLDPDEAQGLIPTHISTASQLNEWEQANILSAEGWLFDRRRSDILTEGFVRRLHREMFGKTWEWAGTYRHTEKNIGVPPHSIIMSVQNAIDDAHYWIKEGTYPIYEAAIRLHHRMVLVHPFPNGNGRHTRMLADALLYSRREKKLTWGRSDLFHDGKTRGVYLRSLKEADKGNFSPLIAFAIS
jgi:Fic-DOC domain mobile mystery protein B